MGDSEAGRPAAASVRRSQSRAGEAPAIGITQTRTRRTTRIVYVQPELRQVGIHMDIQPIEEGSLFQRLRARAFEAAIAQAWLGSYTQKWGAVDSPLGYRNPAVVALMNRLLVTADPEGVDNIHRELTTIFRADLPATYLFPYVFTVIANRRIRGLNSPWRADPAAHMEDLWLDDRGSARDPRACEGWLRLASWQYWLRPAAGGAVLLLPDR